MWTVQKKDLFGICRRIHVWFRLNSKFAIISFKFVKEGVNITRNLCSEVEKVLERLENLSHCELPEQVLASKLRVELSSALAELQAASTELVEQNNEVSSSRLELEEERRRYQELFEFAPDGYLVTDLEGIIRNANSAAAHLFNIAKPFLIGKPLAMLVHHEERPSFRAKLAQIAKGVGIQDKDWEIEMDTCGRAPFPASLTVGTVVTSRGNISELRWLLRDITKRRQLEEDLQKSDKLDALGILAGGIAHDFNNFLTIILGNLSLAKMYSEQNEKVAKYHHEMEKAINQTRNLIGQLLTFSKGGEPSTQAVSIQSFIEEVSSFALSGSKSRWELYIDDLPPMEVDSGQITQVFSNLLINADHSMPAGGTIIISAEQFTAVGGKNSLPLRPGNYIAITIKDEGSGIPKEHLSKIFDPYYTTKEHGNGLGLTICYSIVKKHGGHISVDTEEGVGTTFTVYLPVSRDKVKNDIVFTTLDMGDEKVLFMDDEEDVRNTVGEMLTFLGYSVEFARDGTEAIKMYKEAAESEQPFEVVITDMTIRGGMGGKDTVLELLKFDPDVKAIVSSGYSNDDMMVDYNKYGFSGAVAKPFKLVDLAGVLATVIHG